MYKTNRGIPSSSSPSSASWAQRRGRHVLLPLLSLMCLTHPHHAQTLALRVPSLWRSSTILLSPLRRRQGVAQQPRGQQQQQPEAQQFVAHKSGKKTATATATSATTTKIHNNLSDNHDGTISVSPTLGQEFRALVSTLPARRQLCRELFAEALGTGMIVFLGTAAIVSAVVAGELVGLFQVAAVWMIAVTLAIATTASISGAHLNPAMTLAFVVWRRFSRVKAPLYVVAQMLGSFLASATMYALYATKITAYEAAHGLNRSNALATAKCFGEYYLAPVTMVQAFAAEALGTACLAMVVFALTHQHNETSLRRVYVPPLIGATVGGLICALAPLTQAGFNPARDFAPRIVAHLAGWHSVAFYQCWLYLVAPLVGAPFGGWVADKILFGANLTMEDSST